jgi:hypothetical protein
MYTEPQQTFDEIELSFEIFGPVDIIIISPCTIPFTLHGQTVSLKFTYTLLMCVSFYLPVRHTNHLRWYTLVFKCNKNEYAAAASTPKHAWLFMMLSCSLLEQAFSPDPMGSLGRLAQLL